MLSVANTLLLFVQLVITLFIQPIWDTTLHVQMQFRSRLFATFTKSRAFSLTIPIVLTHKMPNFFPTRVWENFLKNIENFPINFWVYLFSAIHRFVSYFVKISPRHKMVQGPVTRGKLKYLSLCAMYEFDLITFSGFPFDPCRKYRLAFI